MNHFQSFSDFQIKCVSLDVDLDVVESRWAVASGAETLLTPSLNTQGPLVQGNKPLKERIFVLTS